MVQTFLQEQILEKLNALVVVINKYGNAEYVSQSAGQLLGYDSSQLVGENWWEVTRFSRPEGERTKNKILALMRVQNKTSESFEHQFRTKQGGQKWIRWNVSFLSDEQMIGIGYDVTDKKNQEKQLLEKNKQLQTKNQEITDSIMYAKRIQHNSLQSKAVIDKVFKHNFVLYRPKDVVSGDFYFFHRDEECSYAFAIDCTGHGVPGAMMSMVANSIVKEVMLNKKAKAVSQILYELDRELYKAINSNGNEINMDGMDVSVISLNHKKGRLHFAGALRPMIIVRRGEVIEFRASRYPLGFYNDVNKIFEEQVVLVEPGDNLYLFTDGYIDQFGGSDYKKLNKKNFKELLKIAAEMNIEEQEAFLDYSLNNWKQEEEQTDDVLVIGIQV
ncbi:MAG: SpoIIE family protein phosphatase [Sphingobacteriaceae bacterium]|nr:SpoIIE family protein phosphatase [Sphingobacteriaceae bacterium]